MPIHRSAVLSWLADTVLVLAFILIGRASHDEGIAGTVTTFLPFFAALQVGWLLRSGRSAERIRWSGLIIWATTVVLGLLLRAATGDGVALGFIVVTTITLAVFLLGWRAILLGIGAIRRRSRSSSA
ncbi:DUF3054 domain-containing protein [Naasia lichenicola]|uniref:DUF3054 domain-containing protein n=1 Tax=Naasia lichenicola TaxID=2565933 RepID=A0A4S4FRF5_9MICO|nr:DUF3054 domain-containing protein [Naasia lichenicola]THG33230.1 DUF3054 domain-containing protein [Naasia lichenicola]